VVKLILQSNRLRATIIYAVFVFLLSGSVAAQQYTYFYRIYFTDKGTNTVSSYTASRLLSPAAIERRDRAGIPTPDYTDLPVFSEYINQLRSMGFVLHSTSKWMNTALFKSLSLLNIETIRSLPFVRDVSIVKSPATKGSSLRKNDIKETPAGVLQYDRPVTMLNGQVLHKAGFDGRSILIAVMDGGFTEADVIESLQDLRVRGGILFTRDFVNLRENVYDASTHGTAVLSILAGKLSGYIAGTAPGANYMLFKTEDVNTEFPCEEDFWAAAAEFADSAGAAIISSSLGYYSFDDPSMNYSREDLNGNTAFVTRVADMAAAKGILVVNSAGNERNDPWRKIIFPADGDSVVAAGAVDENRIISSFSSAGPTSDGRIKPDVSAMGVAVPFQTTRGYITAGNGTSFSCPVISGMAACLMQAVPEALNFDIIEALRGAGHLSGKPDSLYGYGIPDMATALALLKTKYPPVTKGDVLAYPNPTSGNFSLVFSNDPGTILVEIYSSAGKLLHRNEYESSSRTFTIDDLQYRENGLYLLRISAGGQMMHVKIVRIGNDGR
jgi:serine protease AprX